MLQSLTLFQDLHLGFVLIRYDKVTDRETTALDGRSSLQFTSEGARHTMKGHMRKPWVSREAEREGESMALSPSCDYCGKECTRQGRKA